MLKLETPHRSFAEIDLSEEQLLDTDSLKTVLVMLEVIDCPEDLALLELLTDLQKRQVWDATPPATRDRLKQIRASAAAEVHTASESGQLSEAIQPTPAPSMLKDALTCILPAVGDWVVLKTRPKLPTAELNAIWQVVEIKQGYVRIQTKGLGTRNYPIGWIAIYPKPADADG